MIIECTCKHEGQDAIHGKSRRVANPKARKDKQPLVVRCSVCRKEHTKSGEEKK